MSRLFEDRITPAGREAIQDLIDQVSQELNRVQQSHGKGSMEAAQQGLLLASMYHLMGDYDKAYPLIRSYVTASKEKYGSYSDEVMCGLILLSNNCIEVGPQEDSLPVLEELKLVGQRCLELRAPLLDGLYDLALKYPREAGPVSGLRRFIVLVVALSWWVRHPSNSHIYMDFAPRLKAVFEPYGFVGELWEWLVKRCNPNLHHLMGLIGILLEKRLLPLNAQPPLTAEMREEFLRSLVREFPVHKSGVHGGRVLRTGANELMLRFLCPRCGSRNLRTKQLVAYYPVSTLDGIEVDAETLEFEALHQREDPFEWWGSDSCDGWEFWCDNCHLVPNLEEYDEEEGQEGQLARWLLDNCPQTVEEVPATGH